MGSDCRDLAVPKIRVNAGKTNSLSKAINQRFTSNSNALYELNEGEDIGLQLDERKRRRGETELDQGNYVRWQLKGTVISDGDLSAPGNNDMDELAMQANQVQ